MRRCGSIREGEQSIWVQHLRTDLIAERWTLGRSLRRGLQ